MRILSKINWPDKETNLPRFLERLVKILDQRDQKIATAINSADIEVVTTEPSGEPEYGEPCIKLYYNGSTYRFYAYVDGDWRYAALT